MLIYKQKFDDAIKKRDTLRKEQAKLIKKKTELEKMLNDKQDKLATLNKNNDCMLDDEVKKLDKRLSKLDTEQKQQINDDIDLALKNIDIYDIDGGE